MKKSIFKRIAASAAAMALALAGVVALGGKTVKAQDLAASPAGENITENVLASMLEGEKSLNAWDSQWVQCYEGDLASWIEESNTYFKVTLKNVGKYTGDDGSETALENVFADWGDVSGWLKYLIVNEVNCFPAQGATSDTAYVYVPMSDFELNEYNGIGFNIQAGHIAMTVSAVEIVEEVENQSEDSYYVAGDSGLCGKNWDPAGSLMEKKADGTYSVTYTGIAAGKYEFKVVLNGDWGTEYNLEGNASLGGGNASVEVTEDNSTVVVSFDGEKAYVAVNPVDEPVESDPEESDPAETDPAESDPAETDPAEKDPATDVPSGDSASSILLAVLVLAGVAGAAAITVSRKAKAYEK
ncbi:MAG: hypothetical protein NC302_04165 [Bacteroidales bacterium]|nr:hypothetical protein [Bacteroidales bacterium]